MAGQLSAGGSVPCLVVKHEDTCGEARGLSELNIYD